MTNTLIMKEISDYTLKLLTSVESEAFFSLIQNNLSRLEDFFAGTVSKTKTIQDTYQYCELIEQKIANKEYFPHLIIENETKTIVGLIDVKNIDWNIPKGELGAFIDYKFEGKGLITQLTKALVNQIVIEHGFKKLFCRVAPQNFRSIKAVERIGFELEGTIKRDYKTTKGELVDLNYYGLLFD